MDCHVILTYRCNSKCSMCYIWKNPTDRKHEVTLETLKKMPEGLDYLNLTGGEPTLRSDLGDVCDLLKPKTRTLEISTNGLRPEPLVKIIKKHPDIKIRISIEGLGHLNDEIRGEQDGFDKKIATMKALKEAGGRDLGFAITFQDENIDQLVDVFRLSNELGVELATSALHNAFQFHKSDNYIYDRLEVAHKVEKLIEQMVRSNSVKNWFRGYLNMGLIENILGHDRLLPCTAGTDFFFVDPWSDVYACNVRPDLLVGNLKDQTWDEIHGSLKVREARKKVAACEQNCWMVASAKTVMRSRFSSRLPKLSVVKWVLANKLRVSLGKRIPFQKYIDFSTVYKDGDVVKRQQFLGEKLKVLKQGPVSNHYEPYKDSFNR